MYFGFRSNPMSAIFTAICSVLSVVTALLYRSWFMGSTEYNSYAFICLIAAAALGILSFIGIGSGFQFLLLLAGTMFYIYGMYYYVSIVLVGIDLQSFSSAFIACSALFATTLGLSTLNILVKN